MSQFVVFFWFWFSVSKHIGKKIKVEMYTHSVHKTVVYKSGYISGGGITGFFSLLFWYGIHITDSFFYMCYHIRR